MKLPRSQTPGRGGSTITHTDAFRPPSRRFLIALSFVALVGLTIRLVYLLAAPQTVISYDGDYFHLAANYLADGLGFIDVLAYAFSAGELQRPGAEHPPVWAIVLAIPSFLGFTTRLEHEIFASLVGTTTIVVMGFAGRRLAGARAGLLAATVTALYPGFWLYERQLLSETLAILGAALAVLLALQFRARPSWLRAMAVGAVCGALALTRTEMLLLVVLLLGPLMIFTPDAPWQRRLEWLVVAGGTAAVVISPWVVYNLQRFNGSVLISSQGGRTLSASNCDQTYYGDLLGYKSLFHPGCTRLQQLSREASGGARPQSPEEQLILGDPALEDEELRELTFEYVREHRTRLPLVVIAREGRAWGFYRPFQQLRLDLLEGDILFLRLQYVAYLALLPLAIAGAILLRRRRVPLSPMLALIGVAAITVATTFGGLRYRAAADVAIVLLAAPALAVVVEAVATKRKSAVESGGIQPKVPLSAGSS